MAPSRKRAAASKEEQGVTLKLLRSSGQQDEITCDSLSNTTLKQVKAAIASSKKLGNIPVAQQRIFHLGRELKTLGRSLETLGVGRMGITVLHVHAVPPKKSATTKTAKSQEQPQQQRKVPVRRSTQQEQRNHNHAASSEVVDLLDDDSDDDNDCVVVDEIATANSQHNKRTRRRVR